MPRRVRSRATASPAIVLGACLALLSAWFAGAAASRAAEASPGDPYASARSRMVEAIRADVRETAREIGKTRFDRRVMAAMGEVPRHEFVPSRLRDDAYLNRPLPIGHGQTISQPYVVALMTDLLGADANDDVLEVGTGSGYQAAVLAELVGHVYTVEIVPELAAQAKSRLARLGYENVTARHSDGYFGWKEHAPFDAIVVTAAASHVPPPLLEQLAPGGRMVIPVGSPFSTQQLLFVEKTEDGKVRTRQVLPVSFVPLTREPE